MSSHDIECPLQSDLNVFLREVRVSADHFLEHISTAAFFVAPDPIGSPWPWAEQFKRDIDIFKAACENFNARRENPELTTLLIGFAQCAEALLPGEPTEIAKALGLFARYYAGLLTAVLNRTAEIDVEPDMRTEKRLEIVAALKSIRDQVKRELGNPLAFYHLGEAVAYLETAAWTWRSSQEYWLVRTPEDDGSTPSVWDRDWDGDWPSN